MKLSAAVLTLGLLLAACMAELPRTPVQLALSTRAETIELTLPAELKFGPGNDKWLPVGSQWRAIGTIAQGTVYQPLNTALSIQGANAHEAYLVLSGDRLVGFYLPHERAWSSYPEAPFPLSLRRLP